MVVGCQYNLPKRSITQKMQKCNKQAVLLAQKSFYSARWWKYASPGRTLETTVFCAQDKVAVLGYEFCTALVLAYHKLELRILIYRQYIVDTCEMTAPLYVLMKNILLKCLLYPAQI